MLVGFYKLLYLHSNTPYWRWLKLLGLAEKKCIIIYIYLKIKLLEMAELAGNGWNGRIIWNCWK